MDEYTAAVESIQLVDTKTLQKMLGCCYNTAVRIGKEAGARIQIGGTVRWRVRKISRYLDKMTGDGEEEDE